MTVTKTTRLGTALAVAGLLALAMVGRAGATSPDTFRVPFDETSIEDWSLATCGFDITANLVGVATIEVLRDRNGNPVRVQIHANGTGTFSANGLEIGQATNDTRFLDLVRGTEADVGIPIRLAIPQAGVLTLDVGKLVFDANGNLSLEAGPHPGLEGQSGPAICTALTP